MHVYWHMFMCVDVTKTSFIFWMLPGGEIMWTKHGGIIHMCTHTQYTHIYMHAHCTVYIFTTHIHTMLRLTEYTTSHTYAHTFTE